jgi:hypothetical protein
MSLIATVCGVDSWIYIKSRDTGLIDADRNENESKEANDFDSLNDGRDEYRVNRKELERDEEEREVFRWAIGYDILVPSEDLGRCGPIPPQPLPLSSHTESREPIANYLSHKVGCMKGREYPL